MSARAIAIAMSSQFGVGGSAFRTVKGREVYVDTVAFAGYRLETLEKAGPFNEVLVRNQHDGYNYRIRKMGGEFCLRLIFARVISAEAPLYPYGGRIINTDTGRYWLCSCIRGR